MEAGGTAQPLASEESHSPCARSFYRNYACTAQKIPLPSVSAIRVCEFYPKRVLLITSPGVSLLTSHRVDSMTCVCDLDTLAFALIILSATKLKATGIKVSAILATVVEDSTMYFLFIFASQFVFMMTLVLGRVSAAVPDSLPVDDI